MWKRVSNSSSMKPAEIDTTSSAKNVYVRKGFVLIPASNTGDTDTPEHWEYDEWKMTKSQYEVYQTFKAQMDEQADALIELAEMITEG